MNRRLATKIEMKSASSDRGLPIPARRPAPPSWRHGLATAPPCVQAKFRALMAGQERGLGLRVPPKRRSDLAAFASLESGLELPERLNQTEYEGGARGGGDGGGDRPASGKQATKSRRFNVGGLQAASSVYGSAMARPPGCARLRGARDVEGRGHQTQAGLEQARSLEARETRLSNLTGRGKEWIQHLGAVVVWASSPFFTISGLSSWRSRSNPASILLCRWRQGPRRSDYVILSLRPWEVKQCQQRPSCSRWSRRQLILLSREHKSSSHQYLEREAHWSRRESKMGKDIAGYGIFSGSMVAGPQ